MITRFKGPIIAAGAGPNYAFPNAPDYNDTPGSSLFAHGVGLADIRFGPFGGADVFLNVPGWYGNDTVYCVDEVPSAISATNIATAQVPVAGTPLTLTAGTGLTGSTTVLNALTNMNVANCLAIDTAMATINMAQGAGGALSSSGELGGIALYDPRTAIARNVRISSTGNDSAATFSVSGFDIYGFPMHETITGTSGGVGSGKKAFKYILSITPAGTLSGSNVTVGTGDVYGFPLAVWEFQTVLIYWNSVLISASTGYTAPVTTSPATAITGDVRGTYAVQNASDGTKKLQIFVFPVAWHLDAVGMFGVTQF